MAKSKRGRAARGRKRATVQKRRSSSQRRVSSKKVRKTVRRPVPKTRARTSGRKVRVKKARSITRPRLQIERIAEPKMRQAEKQVLVEEEIGKIDHFYTHLNVGVLEVANGIIKVGDKIRVKGETTDFIQTVKSMQLEHESVQQAKAGQSIGLKVEQRVRQHDKVFLIE